MPFSMVRARRTRSSQLPSSAFDHGFQRRELPLNAANAIERRPVEFVARRAIVNMVIGCHHVTIIPIPL